MRPESEDAIAEAIRGAKGPLAIRGGGTRGFQVEGDILDTGALSGIVMYDPGALTLVARAGTPLKEIEQALSREGQSLAFEPVDHRALTGAKGEPTIGGMVAANVSGPRRVATGACRDFLLGVRFVDGEGRIVKNGGRVMKNVTGYDLVKLMAGSYGTLGVLTEVSLKVLPVSETQRTLVLNGLEARTAIQAMSDALGSPYEVTGAAYRPETGDEAAGTYLRLEGFEGSVTYRARALSDMLARYGAPQKLDAGASEEIWRDMRDVPKLAGGQGDIWRISCRPSQAVGLADRAEARQLLFDWGGGLIWARVPEGTDLRNKLGSFDGHATLVRGQGQPRFHPEPEAVAALSRGIRQRFDPRGILNAGLMTGGQC